MSGLRDVGYHAEHAKKFARDIVGTAALRPDDLC